MKIIQTEVLVIGGGATGTGIARDAAMRGFKTTLVEKRDLSSGTTGRYHGLLHSGGRYVVKDPQAARECIRENQILRRVMPHCLEDTGGYFVVTPWDEPEYADLFLEGCRNAGIPVDEIPIDLMLRQEPLLNPDISRCFRVPDAAADSFLASEINAESARQYGAEILTYHEVTEILTQPARSAQTQGEISVIGARCHNLVNDEEVVIHSDIVVNAAGAWVSKLAETIGIKVNILPGKGTLLALNHRVVNTIINRCKMPSDGDIIVPIHTVAIIGTTDVHVADPDHYAIEPWEINLMLSEGEKIIPGFTNFRILRTWAGVRPLYQDTVGSDSKSPQSSRDISRAFTLLDHAQRDDIEGFITITGGKWTTYRLMAQSTVDLLCAKLNVRRECRTHLEELPTFDNHARIARLSSSQPTMPGARNSGHAYHKLGYRLAKVEGDQSFRDLVCECELATYQDVVQAITVKGAKTLDDIRRDIRLGMGPCQGGFCTYRAAGILHQLRTSSIKPGIAPTGDSPGHGETPDISEQTDVFTTNGALKDFLQERWKGLIPILWGQQLRQERLDELIYLSILNIDHLPGPKGSRLGPGRYLQPDKDESSGSDIRNMPQHVRPDTHRASYNPHSSNIFDVVVIGAGMAGLTAAWRAVQHGKKVRLVTKGWGSTHWQPGSLDIYGYAKFSKDQVDVPRQAIEQMITDNPSHPYARIGIDKLEESLVDFMNLCNSAGYPMHGSLDQNWWFPTAIGAIRPTGLASETMLAGDLHQTDPILVVGFSQLRDFYPAFIADNLSSQGIPSQSVLLDLESLYNRRSIYPTQLATLFEKGEFRNEVLRALKPNVMKTSRIGFPAVLGISNPLEVIHDLETQLGLPVFEIPTLPPSIPGIRLHNILVSTIEGLGGQVYSGIEVTGATSRNARLDSILCDAAARVTSCSAQEFILASGGILGGGITTYPNGEVREAVFNLPINVSADRTKWLEPDFLTPSGHLIFQAGVSTDDLFRPINPNGDVIFTNLYAVGNLLGQVDSLLERSYDGIAFASGYLVGEHLGK